MASALSKPRVLVVLDTASAWSRGILRGFVGAARGRGWTLLHYPSHVDLEWLLATWKPDALLLQASAHPGIETRNRSTKLVSVNHHGSQAGIASVGLDEAAIGELAAEHFLAKGLKHFTTFRYDESPFAVARERAFQRAVVEKGGRFSEGWWRNTSTAPRAGEDPIALARWSRSCPNLAARSPARTPGRASSLATPRSPT